MSIGLSDVGQIGEGVSTILGEAGVSIPDGVDTVFQELSTTTSSSSSGDMLDDSSPPDDAPQESGDGIVDALGSLWQSIWQGGEPGVVDRAEDAAEAGAGAAQARLSLQDMLNQIGPVEVAIGIGLAVLVAMVVRGSRS